LKISSKPTSTKKDEQFVPPKAAKLTMIFQTWGFSARKKALATSSEKFLS
jgi:hypothetical protein